MQYLQKIEKELKNKGITAKKMLLELGYSDNLISQWKKGSEPSAIKLQRICDYLGLSMDYVLKGEITNERDKKMKKILSSMNKMYVSTLKNPLNARILEGGINPITLIPIKPYAAYINDTELGNSLSHEEAEKKLFDVNTLENQNIRLKNLGINRKELEKWADDDFETPPTKEQLYSMLNNIETAYGNDAELRVCLKEYEAIQENSFDKDSDDLDA